MNDHPSPHDAGPSLTSRPPSPTAVDPQQRREQKPDRHWLLILRLMWDRYPGLTLAMAVTGVSSGLASVAVIDTLNKAIHDPESRGALLFAFIGLNLLAIALKTGAAALPAYAAMHIITGLRIALCRRILATPLEEIDRRGAPNVLTLLANDVPALAHSLLLMPTLLTEAAIFVFGIVYLAYLSATAFLLTLTAMVIGLGIHFFFLSRAMAFSRQARDEINTFNEHTYSLVFGIKELKLNGDRRRWFRRDAIDAASWRVARFNFLEQLWFAGGSNIGPLAFALLLGLLVFGAPAVQGLDAAGITGAVLVIMYILGPLSMLVGMIPQFGHGIVACERLAGFGFSIAHPEQPPAGEQPAEPLADEQPQRASWRSIELVGVSTDYHDFESATNFQLGPLSLRLAPGELVYIVGGNGSGKSTLARILAGLYTPREGRILLDGQPVDAHSRDTYRSLFSAVFTDFHLFNRVIASDRTPAAAEAAQDYLARLRLADKVRIDNQRYSTIKALSNGQRKRLALICAYLEDRPIYVLDEWAADQDPAFKRFFYEVLLPDLKSRGKCVVVITHDDQYFGQADRIVKLADGQIVSITPPPAGHARTAAHAAPEAAA